MKNIIQQLASFFNHTTRPHEMDKSPLVSLVEYELKICTDDQGKQFLSRQSSFTTAKQLLIEAFANHGTQQRKARLQDIVAYLDKTENKTQEEIEVDQKESPIIKNMITEIDLQSDSSNTLKSMIRAIGYVAFFMPFLIMSELVDACINSIDMNVTKLYNIFSNDGDHDSVRLPENTTESTPKYTESTQL